MAVLRQRSPKSVTFSWFKKENREIIPLIFDNSGDLLWVYNYAKNIDVINQKNSGDIYLVCEEIKND